jgi:predicted protein tyrosine phosphatase
MADSLGLRAAPSLPQIIKRRNAKGLSLSLNLSSRACHSAPNTPPPLEALAMRRGSRPSNLPLVNIQEAPTPTLSTFNLSEDHKTRRKYSDAGVYYNSYMVDPTDKPFMVDPTDKEFTGAVDDPYRYGPVKIMRNLYLGTEVNARDRGVLDRLNIQYILNVAKEVTVPYQDDQIILSPVKDVDKTSIAGVMEKVIEEEEEEEEKPRGRRRRRRRKNRRNLRSVSRSDMSSSSDVSEQWELELEPTNPELAQHNVTKLKQLVRGRQHLVVQPHVGRVRTPSPLGRSQTTFGEEEPYLNKFATSTPSLALVDEETSQTKIRVRNPSTESLPATTTPTTLKFRLDDSGDSEHDPLNARTTTLLRLRYKKFPWGHNQDNLQEYFAQAFKYIDDARSKGLGVLVHCQLGVSRSASMVLAYVMRAKRFPLHDAYQYVKDRSSVISPNMSLVYQLVEFEKTLNLPRPSGKGGARHLGKEEGLQEDDEK